MIVDAGGGDVGVAESLLHLGGVGLVVERVGGGGPPLVRMAGNLDVAVQFCEGCFITGNFLGNRANAFAFSVSMPMRFLRSSAPARPSDTRVSSSAVEMFFRRASRCSNPSMSLVVVFATRHVSLGIGRAGELHFSVKSRVAG